MRTSHVEVIQTVLHLESVLSQVLDQGFVLHQMEGNGASHQDCGCRVAPDCWCYE